MLAGKSDLLVLQDVRHGSGADLRLRVGSGLKSQGVCVADFRITRYSIKAATPKNAAAGPPLEVNRRCRIVVRNVSGPE